VKPEQVIAEVLQQVPAPVATDASDDAHGANPAQAPAQPNQVPQAPQPNQVPQPAQAPQPGQPVAAPSWASPQVQPIPPSPSLTRPPTQLPSPLQTGA
jgi:hypothetical protein